MTFNPELRRYLILELTPYRLVAAPLILGLIFTTAWAIDGADGTAWAGRAMMIVLLVLWGARSAADAVFGEVADRTWDAQRMSSLGPWSMSWGKLSGSTVFSWYGALFCVPAVLMEPESPVEGLGDMLLMGLFAHAAALFVSLLLLRVRPVRTRFQVNIAHAGGILAALAASGFGKPAFDAAKKLGGEPYVALSWYGLPTSVEDFSLASQLVFLTWTVIGIYRLMRLELQFRPQPLVWLTFVLFVVAYVGGLSIEHSRIGVALDPLLAAAARLTAGFVLVLALTYCTAFLAPSGGVPLRRLAWSLGRGDHDRAFREAPPWLIAAAVALVLTIAICALLAVAPEAEPFLRDLRRPPSLEFEVNGRVALALFAWMLFVIRDLGLIQFVILSPRARRGHLAAAMYLAVLYAGLPILLANTGLEALLPAVVPFLVEGPGGVLAILLQLALVGAGLVWRWRRLEVTDARAPAPAG